MIPARILRGIKHRYAPSQPFEIKGDFEHAYWLAPNRHDRIIYDPTGQYILRGEELEAHYWRLRKGMDWHPLFGTRKTKP